MERDKQSLTDQFTITSETLEVVKADTKSVKKVIDEQSSKVKESLERLDNTLKDLEIQETKRDTEIKTIREEIDTIRDLIPKVMIFLCFHIIIFILFLDYLCHLYYPLILCYSHHLCLYN